MEGRFLESEGLACVETFIVLLGGYYYVVARVDNVVGHLRDRELDLEILEPLAVRVIGEDEALLFSGDGHHTGLIAVVLGESLIDGKVGDLG